MELQLKKYVPSFKTYDQPNLEKLETLVMTSTYDGAFTCVLGPYLLEQGPPGGRPVYKKRQQSLFIFYASDLHSWVVADANGVSGVSGVSVVSVEDSVLWRVRSDAMTPMEITETWEVARPNFYDGDGYPVVNRQQEEWDKVPDTEFWSSRFQGLPDACPCDEKVESGGAEVSNIAVASAVIERSSSSSSSSSDDDE